MVDQQIKRNSKVFETLYSTQKSTFLSSSHRSYDILTPKICLFPPNTSLTFLLCDIAMHILWFTNCHQFSMIKSLFKAQPNSYFFWDTVSTCNIKNESPGS